MVGVEAQFADLPCVFSDKVPQEVKFHSKTKFVSLNEPLQYWIDVIGKYRNVERKSITDELEKSPYNIKSAHYLLENYYLNLKAREGL